MGMKQGLIVSHGNIPNSVCVYLFGVATLWCDPVLCVTSAQSWLVTQLCVKLIPNLEGVVRSCDLACALAIPWCWASLAHSTAFIFEPTLIRLLIWFSISQQLPNQLCHLPFLILLKLSCHILLRHFAHRPTILILRPMSFVQLFVLPALELNSLKHQIQDTRSFQHHTLPWKRLSNFFSKQTIIILGHRLWLPPPLSTPPLSATIPLTCTMSVVA